MLKNEIKYIIKLYSKGYGVWENINNFEEFNSLADFNTLEQASSFIDELEKNSNNVKD